MLPIKRFFREKYFHEAFEITLVLKGIHAVIEIAGGILIYFIAKDTVTRFVLSITREELLEDPKDFISHYLIKSAEQLSVSSQHFAALYLLTHGIIKIFLVAELLKKRLWAYPASIIVFGLFMTYQLYRFTHTHSPWLIFFTLLDVVVIWLTVHEYRHMKKPHTS